MPRPARPLPPPHEPAIAVALSGGGFRATLAGLGVLRFLADAQLLPQVRYISSVSGGSITNGLLASQYEQLELRAFAPEALDDLIVRPLVERISSKSLSRQIVQNLWRVVGPGSRTDLLAQILDRWFFRGCQLEELSPNCRFIINAANVTSGVRFGFERDVVGDWVMGRVPAAGTGLLIAHAVAASAAVMGRLQAVPFQRGHCH